jgi:hypothetical protein
VAADVEAAMEEMALEVVEALVAAAVVEAPMAAVVEALVAAGRLGRGENET